MSQSKLSKADTERTEYELIRARHGTFALGTTEGAIRWFGYGLFALSLVVPILWLLPEPVVEAHFTGAPHRATIMLVPIMIVTMMAFVSAGVGLAWVERRRRELYPVPDDDAWKLVGYEDISSGFGIITGGLGLAVSLVLGGAGYLGVDTYEWLLNNGVHPYGQFGMAQPTVLTIGVMALVSGLVLIWLSRRLAQQNDPAGEQ